MDLDMPVSHKAPALAAIEVFEWQVELRAPDIR